MAMNGKRAGIWAAGCLLGALCLHGQGEDVPREMCVFVDVAKVSLKQEAGQRDEATRGLGSDVRPIRGVTFDLRSGGVALRAGERLVLTTNDFVYAGEGKIEDMTHKDMGPLVFYAVQTVHLLHGVTGKPSNRRVGRVVFGYEDGSTAEEDLYLGENICSPKVPARWAQMVTNGFCMTSVLNPVPYEDMTFEPGKGHAFRSVTIAIDNRDVVYRVAAITCELGRQKVHE